MLPAPRAILRPFQVFSIQKRHGSGMSRVEVAMKAAIRDGPHFKNTIWTADEHLPPIAYYPRKHGIPCAVLHFRSHHPRLLELFTYFATHTGSALGIPMSQPIHLPTQRSLWTVIKGPFAHKKSQENFDRKVYKRAIKAWDAHPAVIGYWAEYLREHQVPGVGLRVSRWERAPLGITSDAAFNEIRETSEKFRLATSRYQIVTLGDAIVKTEIAAALDALKETQDAATREGEKTGESSKEESSKGKSSNEQSSKEQLSKEQSKNNKGGKSKSGRS
ncbi:hypothetical protein M422DRAFT_33667 [Sphaerobolus stellatus SS14]|uniref:Small ribosomal subunit protein uS10 domain-containing protein n=1 Tax=Sphaerobolus stellatus (strain SS14) TaxID=990650 RepID=A0A0C9U3U6_SPHS4|nr:hypothetical protein M422DRAFT_33667 [Sphaerobolus stellatus SS14]